MDQSRSRLSKKLNHKHHISSHKHPFRELLLVVMGLCLWVYILSAFYVLIDALFALNHPYPMLFDPWLKFTQRDISTWVLRLIVIALVEFFLLYHWSFYNRKRYGKLHRRIYPSESDVLEILDLNRLDPTLINHLRGEKHLIFAHNPVRPKKLK